MILLKYTLLNSPEKIIESNSLFYKGKKLI